MIVRGYASTSDMDHVRHVVDPSAFAASVSVVTFPCNDNAGMTSFGKSDGTERVIELAQQLKRILTA